MALAGRMGPGIGSPPHPKGEFMPGSILRGWPGGGIGKPLHKVPDHVPFSDLDSPDHVPFPRHIVLVESKDGHSMLAVL